jgi:hypothetical protein
MQAGGEKTVKIKEEQENKPEPLSDGSHMSNVRAIAGVVG